MGAILALLSLLGLAGVITLFVYLLAMENKFFTLIPERAAVDVLKGKRHHRFIMAFKGHWLDEETTVQPLKPLSETEPAMNAPGPVPTPVTSAVPPVSRKKPSDRGKLLPWRWWEPLGIHYYGFYPFYKLGEYRFVWMEPEKTKE